MLLVDGEEGCHPEWIWGDESETTVFAQAYGSGYTVIFSFKLDSNKPKSSLANRLCNCYHNLEVDDLDATFPDRPTMREALWRAVRQVWSGCILDPSIGALDAVVDVDANGTEPATWKLYHHPLFPKFVALLKEFSSELRHIQRQLERTDFDR